MVLFPVSHSSDIRNTCLKSHVSFDSWSTRQKKMVAVDCRFCCKLVANTVCPAIQSITEKFASLKFFLFRHKKKNVIYQEEIVFVSAWTCQERRQVNVIAQDLKLLHDCVKYFEGKERICKAVKGSVSMQSTSVKKQCIRKLICTVVCRNWQDLKQPHSTVSSILKDKERIGKAVKGSVSMRSTFITDKWTRKLKFICDLEVAYIRVQFYFRKNGEVTVGRRGYIFFFRIFSCFVCEWFI